MSNPLDAERSDVQSAVGRSLSSASSLQNQSLEDSTHFSATQFPRFYIKGAATTMRGRESLNRDHRVMDRRNPCDERGASQYQTDAQEQNRSRTEHSGKASSPSRRVRNDMKEGDPTDPNPVLPVKLTTNMPQQIPEVLEILNNLTSQQAMLELRQEIARKELEQCQREAKSSQAFYTAYPGLAEKKGAMQTKAEETYKLLSKQLEVVKGKNAETWVALAASISNSKGSSDEKLATKELQDRCKDLEAMCAGLKQQNDNQRKEFLEQQKQSEVQKQDLTELKTLVQSMQETARQDQSRTKSQFQTLIGLPIQIAVTQGRVDKVEAACAQLRQREDAQREDTSENEKQVLTELKTKVKALEEKYLQAHLLRKDHDHLEQQLLKLVELPVTVAEIKNQVKTGLVDATELKELKESQEYITHVLEKMTVSMTTLRTSLHDQTQKLEQQAKLIASHGEFSLSPKSNTNESEVVALQALLSGTLEKYGRRFKSLETKLVKTETDSAAIRRELAEDKNEIVAFVQDAVLDAVTNLSNSASQNLVQFTKFVKGQEAVNELVASSLEKLDSAVKVSKDLNQLAQQHRVEDKNERFQKSIDTLSQGLRDMETKIEAINAEHKYFKDMDWRTQKNMTTLGQDVADLHKELQAVIVDQGHLKGSSKGLESNGTILKQGLQGLETKLQAFIAEQHQIDTNLGSRYAHLETTLTLLQDHIHKVEIAYKNEVHGLNIATENIDSRLTNFNTNDMYTHIINQMAVQYPYAKDVENAYRAVRTDYANLNEVVNTLQNELRASTVSREARDAQNDYDSSMNGVKSRLSLVSSSEYAKDIRDVRRDLGNLRKDMDSFAAISIPNLYRRILSVQESLTYSSSQAPRTSRGNSAGMTNFDIEDDDDDLPEVRLGDEDEDEHIASGSRVITA